MLFDQKVNNEQFYLRSSKIKLKAWLNKKDPDNEQIFSAKSTGVSIATLEKNK